MQTAILRAHSAIPSKRKCTSILHTQGGLWTLVIQCAEGSVLLWITDYGSCEVSFEMTASPHSSSSLKNWEKLTLCEFQIHSINIVSQNKHCAWGQSKGKKWRALQVHQQASLGNDLEMKNDQWGKKKKQDSEVQSLGQSREIWVGHTPRVGRWYDFLWK